MKKELIQIEGLHHKDLDAITSSLQISRDILASDDEIWLALQSLPWVLNDIPRELITKGIAKMCIAVSCWLFDSGLNYIWNESINEIRKKVVNFWLFNVWELLNKESFDDRKLYDLKDSELIDLALQLNLITEEGFFHLDKCRDIRNHFSAAHHPLGDVDQYELLNFSNKCVRYALSNENNPIGVNIWEFTESLKNWKYDNEQIKAWIERLTMTHQAQRELLLWRLYFMYCDDSSSETTRVNALTIFLKMDNEITPSLKSLLLEQHQNYVVDWKEKSRWASRNFFENTGNLHLLWESELNSVLSKACKNLIDSHHWMQNFHNEPPFAERLYELSDKSAIPSILQQRYVETVLLCWVWNGYGVSTLAFPFYKKMVAGFSPKEIQYMFSMADDKDTLLWRRLSYWGNYKSFFKWLVENIDESSVPTEVKSSYNKWL